MSRREVAGFAVGASPRVDLLPPEVRAGQQDRKVRRWFILGALLALVVVVGGYALATVVAVQAQSALDQAQARTDDLLAQQQQYAEVRDVKRQLDVAGAASRVGSSTEIDWADYARKIMAELPAGVGMVSMNADSATPLAAFPQATAPLQPARIAELVLTASSPTLPNISDWLDGLHTIPGVADVTTRTIVAPDGTYLVDLTVHLDRTTWKNQPTEEKEEVAP